MTERQSFAQIRRKIIESLEISPKSIHELMQDTSISRPAIENHLHYLWKLGLVFPARVMFQSKKELWCKR